jgi:hypothetical protein
VEDVSTYICLLEVGGYCDCEYDGAVSAPREPDDTDSSTARCSNPSPYLERCIRSYNV